MKVEYNNSTLYTAKIKHLNMRTVTFPRKSRVGQDIFNYTLRYSTGMAQKTRIYLNKNKITKNSNS